MNLSQPSLPSDLGATVLQYTCRELCVHTVLVSEYHHRAGAVLFDSVAQQDVELVCVCGDLVRPWESRVHIARGRFAASHLGPQLHNRLRHTLLLGSDGTLDDASQNQRSGALGASAG